MKSLLLLPMLMLGILFTSCTKENITQEVVIPNKTIQFIINANQWQFDSRSQTQYVDIPVPEIDDYANENNGILVYISEDQEMWEAIPDVLNGSTFIYRYSQGRLFIEVQNADGSVSPAPDYTIYAKVVIVESAPIP